MGQGKRAWIYCAIDAPEDRNGALKSQFKQLIDYGEQMGFELVGSSSASYGKTGQLLRVSGAAVPFRTVRSTAMLARSATGEVNTVIYLYPAC